MLGDGSHMAFPRAACFAHRESSPLVFTILISTPFWSKKIKIAILALATFAALC